MSRLPRWFRYWHSRREVERYLSGWRNEPLCSQLYPDLYKRVYLRTLVLVGEAQGVDFDGEISGR